MLDDRDKPLDPLVRRRDHDARDDLRPVVRPVAAGSAALAHQSTGAARHSAQAQSSPRSLSLPRDPGPPGALDYYGPLRQQLLDSGHGPDSRAICQSQRVYAVPSRQRARGYLDQCLYLTSWC